MYETKSTGSATGPALGGSRPTLAPASLAERLDYLQRAVERAVVLRRHLENLADQISPTNAIRPENPNPIPQPDGMSQRFGEALSALHGNLDEIENFARRIDFAVFGSSEKERAVSAMAQCAQEGRRG